MATIHEDLVGIRNKAGLTSSDIQQKTKIPESVIREIEKGFIFSSTDTQKTYIRSFTRSYAKAVGIKDDDIVKALDLREEDNYDGFLGAKYLQKTKPPVARKSDSDAVTEAEIEEAEEETYDASILKPVATSTIGAEEYSRPDPSRAYNKVTPAPPKMETIDWADVGHRFTGITAGSATYAILFVIVILLAGGTYLALNWSDLITNDTETLADNVVTEALPSSTLPAFEAPDTTEPSAGTASAQRAPSARFGMPDTLLLVVHAANNKLEPVRVLSDVNNIRSPYWIETGEAMRFDFINQIEIIGNLSRMAIYLNGHYLPNIREFSVESNTIRITREALSERPALFTEEPGKLPSGVSPPSVIRNRPIF